jgi:hypothetical protein
VDGECDGKHETETERERGRPEHDSSRHVEPLERAAPAGERSAFGAGVGFEIGVLVDLVDARCCQE